MSAISIRSACSAGVGGYELTVVIELHTLADMEALVDGDRWLSPPSWCNQHNKHATNSQSAEYLVLCVRRSRERRARVSPASL